MRRPLSRGEGASGTLLAALLLAGCGGHGSSSSASAAVGKGRGKATISVRWPDRGRLIPNAANSIVVKLTMGTTVVSKTLARPPDGSGSTSATLTGLKYGAYTVAVNAYPTATGTGTAQAAGAGSMTVTEDTPGTVAVAMDSTVASLALVPNASSIALNETVGVAASATDASGAIVLLAVGTAGETLAWTASPAASATIAGTGPVVSVTGLVAGPVTLGASLKIKDDGTSLSASTVLNISAAADYRLAVGGYPKTGGDLGNTGQGGGSGAAGAVGWTAQVGTAAVGAVVVEANGTVYAGSGGLVTAVSRDGAPLWQATVAGTVNGLLLTRGGGVLVSAAKLTSLAGGGTVDWTFPDDFGVTFASGEGPFAPSVTPDGTVVAATNSKVYALDPYAKAVRWTVPFASSSGAAVMADSTVVVANNGEMRGLAGATGAQTFSLPRTASSGTPPMPSKKNYGKWVPITRGFGFFAAPCAQGTGVTIPEAVYTGTAGVGYKRGIVPSQDTYYSIIEGNDALSLRTLTGSTAVAYASPSNYLFNSVPVPTALSEDPVGRFLLTYSGKTVSTKGWSVAETGSAGASVGSDGTVYFATTDAAGLVEAVDPASGAVRWTATLPAQGTGLRPAIGPDGSVYAGTTDGWVVQIR